MIDDIHQSNKKKRENEKEKIKRRDNEKEKKEMQYDVVQHTAE